MTRSSRQAGRGAGQRPRADRARAPGSRWGGVPSGDGSNRSWERGEQADGGRDVESRSPERLILPPPALPPPAPEVYSLLTAFMWINLILALTQSSEGGEGGLHRGKRMRERFSMWEQQDVTSRMSLPSEGEGGAGCHPPRPLARS